MGIESLAFENKVEHSSESYSVRELADLIKQMELELGLLTDESYGRSARIAWEASRFALHTQLKQKLAGHGVAHTPAADYRRMSPVRLAQFTCRLLRDAFLRGILRAPRRKEFLLWAHPRREWNAEGFYEDVYTDEIASVFGGRRTLILEKPYNWKHFRPTPNRVWYADLQLLLFFLLAPFFKMRRRPDLRAMARDIGAYVATRTGTSFSVLPLLKDRASAVERSRLSFCLMLRWLKPQSVLLVVSYTQPGLILAARDLAIPTIELQHGVITEQHLGYSFPPGTTKLSFPDHIWLFGEYWKETVRFPIEEARIRVLGYPFFERARAQIKTVRRERSILFISQGTIGAQLSRFAVDLAQRLGPGWQIVYKLHPGEWDRWRSSYPWLAEASDGQSMSVIDGHSPSLYDLQARSLVQIGVNSTAIFEGLALGCPAILVDLPGVEYMDPLVERGYARVVSRAADIDLDRLLPVLQSDKLFYPRWIERLHELENAAGIR